MKYTNLDIINVVNFLTDMSNKRLPQRIGYAVVRNLKMFKENYDLYIASLNGLVENYKDHFIKDDNGDIKIVEVGVPDVDESVKEEYLNEINDLLKIEVDIDTYKISEELFDYDDEKYDTLLPKEMLLMEDLFGDK